MSGGGVLDLILLVAVALFAVSGYRQGFLVGALSFVGFLGGGLLGAAFAPAVAERLGDTISPTITGIVVVFLAAAIGQIIASAIGAVLRGTLVGRGPLRVVDSGAGALLSAVGVLLVAWFVGSAVVGAPYPRVVAAVRSSSVLAAVDAVVPDQARTALSAFRRLLDQSAFPRVFAGIAPPAQPSAPPPAPGLASTAGVEAARNRILKVTGVAPACSRGIEGSGFVYFNDRVLTNAHVVAGVRSPMVQAGSRMLPARVVVYDPDRDVAVLYVPGLNLSPLSFVTGLAPPGADAVVVGYPQDGPLKAVPARIRGVINARGPDIYQRRTVTRQVYSLRAEVLPGNSGGPLLRPDGQVYGLVFAAAVGEGDVGYALTSREVEAPAAAGRFRTAVVGTGGCD